MKLVPIFFLVFNMSLAYGKEDCSLEALGLDESSNRAEILFYQGTCHYRNEDYEYSAKYWGELSALKDLDAEFKGLQIDSLNNLGYLKFYGLGISDDKRGAIEHWKKAVLLGHEESEYHLCHAYADKEGPTFNLEHAKKHCEKALLIYQAMEEPNEEILSQIKYYSSKL